MRFTAFSVLALVTSAIATHPIIEGLRELKARQDAGTLNQNDTGDAIGQFISALGLTGTATFATTVPTCLGGYNPPPMSIYGQILTAVPGSVLADLANPNARSSLASEISAGNTPSWYHEMPTAVKSYISSLHANKPTGCTPTTTSKSQAGATGGAGVFIDEDGNLATSTSEDAAQATAAVGMGIAGVMGFIGLMMVL